MTDAHTPSDPPVVALVSLGCPKNLVDSEKMLADLAEAGCIVGAPLDEADVIVINTCGFLQASRDESLEVLAEAAAYKQTGPARRIVLAGCLAQRDKHALFELADSIDAIVGVNDREQIVPAVLGTGTFTAVSDEIHPYLAGQAGPHDAIHVATGDAGRFRLTAPHTAYLRIAEGCSRQCAFCTIPSIRGPMRSKPLDMVLDEARELIASGALELNVIAQDTTAWGEDFSQTGTGLPDLLGKLDRLDGLAWIRLMYTYPQRFSPALIDRFAAADRILPYVDMPLQHISSSVLKRMRRGVTGDQVRSLLDTMYSRIEGLLLRTSFIVGFPGETDEDFEQLLTFVQDYPFEAMGVFEFSPEPDTPAAHMEPAVPAEVAAERAQRLMEIQAEIVGQRSEDRIGQELAVLVDGQDEDGYTFGRFYGQAPDIDGVCILDRDAEPGTFVRARILGPADYDLACEVIEE